MRSSADLPQNEELANLVGNDAEEQQRPLGNHSALLPSLASVSQELANLSARQPHLNLFSKDIASAGASDRWKYHAKLRRDLHALKLVYVSCLKGQTFCKQLAVLGRGWWRKQELTATLQAAEHISAASYATDSVFDFLRSELHLTRGQLDHDIEYGATGPVQWSAEAVANFYQLILMAFFLAIPANHGDDITHALRAERENPRSRPQRVASMLHSHMPEGLLETSVDDATANDFHTSLSRLQHLQDDPQVCNGFLVDASWFQHGSPLGAVALYFAWAMGLSGLQQRLDREWEKLKSEGSKDAFTDIRGLEFILMSFIRHLLSVLVGELKAQLNSVILLQNKMIGVMVSAVTVSSAFIYHQFFEHDVDIWLNGALNRTGV